MQKEFFFKNLCFYLHDFDLVYVSYLKFDKSKTTKSKKIGLNLILITKV